VVALAFLAAVFGIIYHSLASPDPGQLPAGLAFLSGILIRDYLAIRQDKRNEVPKK
jgi:hypothetical protein